MARPRKVTEESTAAEAAKMNEDVKAAEKKETGAKKTTTRKTGTKKADDGKEEAVKAETPKKATARKTTAKKAEEPATTVTIQFGGKNVAAKDVVEAAKKAYMEANPDGVIESVDIYVKPEESAAYYAVNGKGSEDYKIQL